MSFIVLGDTAGVKSSKRILGRYKDFIELKDVFEVSRLRKQARRLLIFRVVNGVDDDTWYLISFDIKGVTGKVSGRTRYATKEYTIIKEGMFWNLCGRIDNSTYICPNDCSDIPRRFTKLVSAWTVKPYDSKTLEAMKNSVSMTLLWIKLQLLTQLQKLHGKGRAKAKELVGRAETLMKAPWLPRVEKLLNAKIGLSEEVSRLKKALGISNRLETPKTRVHR